MKGIVLISHGEMAKGMAQSATLFLGNNIEQLAYCCLYQEDAPEEFQDKIKEAIDTVNTNDGVIILADMFGGTPCNQAIGLLNEEIDLLVGMNFVMFLDIMMNRENGNFNLDSFVMNGKNSISNVKKILAENKLDDDDE